MNKKIVYEDDEQEVFKSLCNILKNRCDICIQLFFFIVFSYQLCNILDKLYIEVFGNLQLQ